MLDQSATIDIVVFKEAAVPDYQNLIAGFPDNRTYFVLDAQNSDSPRLFLFNLFGTIWQLS